MRQHLGVAMQHYGVEVNERLDLVTQRRVRMLMAASTDSD